MIAGERNARGTLADATYDGVALAGDVHINAAGSDLTNYPPGSAGNFCGPLPYLVNYAKIAGADEVNIVRNATTGSNLVDATNAVGAIVTVLEGKGWTPDYWLFWGGEAESLNPGASPPGTYAERLEAYAQMVWSHYPECRLVIASLCMSTNDFPTPGASDDWPTVEAQQRAFVATHATDGRALLIDARAPSQVTMGGTANVDCTVGAAGGIDTMMSRFRELWPVLDVEDPDPDVPPTPGSVELHDDDDWLGPLRIAAGASSDMQDLSDEIQRVCLAMTGDAISTSTDATGAGILVGTYDDWEADDYGYASPGDIPAHIVNRTYDHTLVSHNNRLLVLGRDDEAVAHAWWRFMRYLGYYSLFPTDTWEVIPSYVRINVKISRGFDPPMNFLSAMGTSGGVDAAEQARADNWYRRNLIPTGGYNTAHTWQAIRIANQAEFDDHDEYMGSTSKLCVFVPRVRELALLWVQGEIAAHPERVVTSIAAADSTVGWDVACATTGEQALYTPTDRQIILANYVQDQIDQVTTRGALYDWELGSGTYITETSAEKCQDYADSIRGSDPTTAAKWDDLGSEPAPLWCAQDYGNAHRASGIDAHLDAAAAAGTVPIFVLYWIMKRNGSSTAGAPSLAAYQAEVDLYAAAVNGRDCIWIIEPDAISLLYRRTGGVNGAEAEDVKDAIAYAVAALTAAGARCYIDSGDNNFRPVSEIAAILASCNIATAAGIALNVAHTELIDDEYQYYLALKAVNPSIGNLVIDTARSGLGHYDSVPGDRSDIEYINPPGRALGPRPTTKMDVTNYPGLDALLWVKYPGTSDDNSPPGAPDPGDLYPSYWEDIYDRSVGLDLSAWEPQFGGGGGDNQVRLAILAYGAMSVPPLEDINPRLVVTVTDGFIQAGQDRQDVVDAYVAKGATDFISYAYSGLWPFSLARPGLGRAAKPELTASDMAFMYGMPGTIAGLVSEGCAGWAVWGLGYWLTAQMADDPLRVDDEEELRDEFLLAAFGEDNADMTGFFDILRETAPLSEDMLHRMYQFLSDALAASPSAAIEERIYDMAIYTRYLELLQVYTESDDIADFDALILWMWRIRGYGLVPVRLSYNQPASWQPLFEELEALYPGSVFTFGGAKPTTGIWVDRDTAITHAELDDIIADGLLNNDLLPFTPIGYSDDLVYVARAHDARANGAFIYSNRDHFFTLVIPESATGWTLTHRAGYASDADGPAFLNIIDPASGETVHQITCLVDTDTTETVTLAPGTYRVEVDANSGVHWSSTGIPWTHITNFEPAQYQGDFSGYFYVPAGATSISGYCNAAQRFRNPANTLIYTHGGVEGYFTFAITPPATAEIWKFENANARFVLMDVPPGISIHPDELLIPRELS